MQVEFFDEDRFFKTGKLFSDQFEDRKKFVYHGTSTLCSPAIESSGFQYPFFSVPAAELEALADSLAPDGADLASTLRSAAKPTKLGFAPYSYAAVEYAQMRGGQVLSLCRDAVQAGGKPLPGGVIEARLRDYGTAQGCVYAVDLSQSGGINIAFEHVFFQCASEVPSVWLAAKVLIPSDLDVKRLRDIQAFLPLSGAVWEPGSLAATLKRGRPEQGLYTSEFV
jgi:hypothetical protein